jgi:hypothetical protein
MKRSMCIACGVSVLFTTLAFGHIMIHDTQRMLAEHESMGFIVGHSVVALVLGILSLAGGFSLLTGPRPQKPA